MYCPKLSRAACPVSNVEKNEGVTPWGKMSMAFFADRGDVPLEAQYAEPAWACSSCYACRDRCDHKNEVATVLSDARAELFAHGLAPEAAKRVAAGHLARSQRDAKALDAISTGASGAVKDAVLVGCGYVRGAPDVARDALEALSIMTGTSARPVRACCGLPLLHAGDRDGFVAAARAFASEVAGARTLHVVDPGCARALMIEYPRLGVTLAPPVRLFVDTAHAHVQRTPKERLKEPANEAVRWHDPCQLGRGLGRFDEPRAILERITGAPPLEFLRARREGECSGGGGLLPSTRPETSRAMADARINEHRERGSGVLVTHCASSLQRFRSRGEQAVDLVSLVARALRP